MQRRGCELCEHMLLELTALKSSVALPAIEVIDVDSDPELARLIRLHATRKTVLYNGALECRLYEYHMVRGGNRPEDKRPKLDAKRGAVDKVARAGSRGKRT